MVASKTRQVKISEHIFQELSVYLKTKQSFYSMRRYIDESVEMRLKSDAQISIGEKEGDSQV